MPKVGFTDSKFKLPKRFYFGTRIKTVKSLNLGLLGKKKLTIFLDRVLNRF